MRTLIALAITSLLAVSLAGCLEISLGEKNLPHSGEEAPAE